MQVRRLHELAGPLPVSSHLHTFLPSPPSQCFFLPMPSPLCVALLDCFYNLFPLYGPPFYRKLFEFDSGTTLKSPMLSNLLYCLRKTGASAILQICHSF